MKIKITMRCYFTPLRVAVPKKSEKKPVAKGMDKWDLCTVGGNPKWCSHYSK